MNFPNFRLSKKRRASQLPRGQKRCVGENEVGNEKEITGTSCLEKKKMTLKASFRKIRLFLANTSERQAFSLVETFFPKSACRFFQRETFLYPGK